MVKKKWVTASLLVMCMAATTACTSSSDKPVSSSTPTASSSSSGESNESKPALKVLKVNQPEDYNTYPVAKVLEQRTGYKVQYDMLPADKPQEKLNLIIASAEPYDLITTSGGSDFTALYADYAKKGALTDLTPLIDQYGPNIKSLISQSSFDSMKVDGKIYAIPNKAIEFVSSSLMIRQDWLDKLDLKAPTTLNELVHVLKEFKEKDPGGNGDKNIPMTISGDAPLVESIVGAFGIPNSWNPIDGKLTPRALDPGYKEYIEFMKGLFDQGLLDKEFAVNKDATMKEKLTSGRAGVVQLNWGDIPGIFDALEANQPNAKLVYLGPLTGKDGKSGFMMTAGIGAISYIPKSAKHPEDTIKWIDALLEKETFKLMAIGEEGTHHTVQDNAYYPVLPIFNDERNRSNNYMVGLDEENFPTYWQARVRKDMRLFEGWEFLNTKQPDHVKFADPFGIAPYLPEFSKNNLQLTTMLKDHTTKLIFGAESLDNLEAFQQKYKAAGGDASIQEVNEWYVSLNK